MNIIEKIETVKKLNKEIYNSIERIIKIMYDNDINMGFVYDRICGCDYDKYLEENHLMVFFEFEDLFDKRFPVKKKFKYNFPLEYFEISDGELKNNIIEKDKEKKKFYAKFGIV